MSQFTVRQHVPSFVDTDADRITATFSAIEEIFAHPWFGSWAKDPGFYRYSQATRDGGAPTLMIERHEGNWQWVLGYMSNPVDWLPEWEEGPLARLSREAWNRGDTAECQRIRAEVKRLGVSHG